LPTALVYSSYFFSPCSSGRYRLTVGLNSVLDSVGWSAAARLGLRDYRAFLGVSPKNAAPRTDQRYRDFLMTDIEKYVASMKEIELRTEVIDLCMSGQREARYDTTTIETIGLQFRKVFELIAFASLASNRAELD
jgi:hypothetical protein